MWHRSAERSLKEENSEQTTPECATEVWNQKKQGVHTVRKEPGVNDSMEAKAAKGVSCQWGGCLQHLVLSPLLGEIVGSLAQHCSDGM